MPNGRLASLRKLMRRKWAKARISVNSRQCRSPQCAFDTSNDWLNSLLPAQLVASSFQQRNSVLGIFFPDFFAVRHPHDVLHSS